MSSFRPNTKSSSQAWQQAAAAGIPRGTQTSLARPLPRNLSGNFKWLSIIILVIVASNALTHLAFNPQLLASATASATDISAAATPEGELFLMNKARVFVSDTESFEKKVREISHMLAIPPEWLMAVMYSESKFDAGVENFKGSGATGLIQFMPAAASEMNVSLSRLKRMTHVQQLEYVYLYLQTVRDRYGDFRSLTDLYLGILYPKAIGQDFCYTLYAHPSKSYRQNSGLDENKDHHVTVSDIDQRMKRLFATAYMTPKA